ncbi:MAG: hypothetical protein KDA58_07890 [Planctomycetaceae bacterium]|nr:hypothetical protein [Planctomycetaceae bacterium]
MFCWRFGVLRSALLVLLLFEVDGQAELSQTALERPIHHLRKTAACLKIEAALLQDVPEDLGAECSLAELAQRLRTTFQIPVIVNEAALSGAMLDANRERVRLPAGARLDQALTIALPGASGRVDGLAWQVRSEALEFTTEYDADEHLIPIVYDLRGLGPEWRDHPDRFRELLLKIDAGEWSYIDGWMGIGATGDLKPFTGGVVVLHTYSKHREVEQLIRKLQSLSPLEVIEPHPPVPQPERLRGTRPTPLEQRWLAALDGPTPSELSSARNLEEVATILRKSLQLPLQIDMPSLAFEGVDAETKIRVPQLAGASLRSTLDWAISDVGGVPTCHMVARGQVWITTETKADDDLVTRFYDLAGLPECFQVESYRLADISQLFVLYLEDGVPPDCFSQVPGGIILTSRRSSLAQFEAVLRQLRLFAAQTGYPQPLEYDPWSPVKSWQTRKLKLPVNPSQRLHPAMRDEEPQP